MPRRLALSLLGVLAVALAAIQLVPLTPSNPAVVAEPTWSSGEIEQLARAACYDCHSNEVDVPWYGHVAPVSWVLRRHVDEGREKLNFSEMDRSQPEAHEAGDEVLEGEMPPRGYALLHPDARLTRAQRRLLAEGLDVSLGVN